MTETRAPAPHADDVPRVAQRRWGVRWRRIGQLGFYAFTVAFAALLAVLLVVGVLDNAEPRIWGTFIQTDCWSGWRGGCRPLGTWISDDGDIIKHAVYLDGWPDGTGTARASYRPTGILVNDSIVHTAELTYAGPWIIGAILLFLVGYALYRAASWGDIVIPSRRRRRRGRGRRTAQLTGSTTRSSPRRRYRRTLERGAVSDESTRGSGT